VELEESVLLGDFQRINYLIYSDDIFIFPLLSAPCSPPYTAIDYFFNWKSLEAIANGTDTIQKHNFGRVSNVTRN
jgi:hypothetical protein